MTLPESARRFLLETAPIVHLVTLNADGSPHVTMTWVDVQGDRLVTATLFDQLKLRNVRRDPRVVVSAEGTTVRPPGLREYLVIEGTAVVEEGGAADLLSQLGKRYLGPDAVFPPMPNPPDGFLTWITPSAVKGVGPWTD
jgi:PPOX class probable F420-dependent enzyme